MSKEGVFLMVIFMVLVLGGCLFAFLISMLRPKEQIEPQPKAPRILLPTDKKVYTFTLDSELKSEEWEMILNAGWLFITCTTEQRKEYANCGPESPSYNKTYWHYVFQNKQ
jgi:hypothetical protein